MLRRITLRGRVYCPQKHSREGSLRTLPTPLAERPRALALTFQRDNTRQEGLGEDLTEKDQGQAQKVKIRPSGFDRFPGVIRYVTICYFWTTPRDLAVCVFPSEICTLPRPVSHRAWRKSPFGNRRRVGREIHCDDKKWSIF